MNSRSFGQYSAVLLGALFVAVNSPAALYYGPLYNPDTPAGGAVSGGMLSIAENPGRTGLDIIFTRGGQQFDGALVIYFDTVAQQGFQNTSGFTDDSGLAQRAISGLIGSQRSVANFNAPGNTVFGAEYALVLTMQGYNSSGIYQLVNGPDGTHVLQRTVTISPGNAYSDASFSGNIYWSNLGLSSTPANQRGFRFVTTYFNYMNSRTLESFEHLTSDSYAGQAGQIWFSDYHVFGVEPVPEMTNAALCVFGAVVVGGGMVSRLLRHRRRIHQA